MSGNVYLHGHYQTFSHPVEPGGGDVNRTVPFCRQSDAVERAGSSSRNLTQTVRNIDYNCVRPTIYTDNANLSYRLDGNNVDIDTEQVELASNQLYYNGVIDGINQNFSRIRTALTTT